MRYRALTSSGDYSFGHGGSNFLVNSPACVAQSVLTRLKLWTGEWFLDVTEGMPWSTEVLGSGTKPIYDIAIRDRVLQTTGVSTIAAYESTLDPSNRKLSVQMTLDTIYGQTAVAVVL